MEYCVKLDLFEGPLDLLLHLVQKSKIEIADISMATITEQYLDYLDRMRDFDVEIASEFLVMASTLLLIKSRALLPGLTIWSEMTKTLNRSFVKDWKNTKSIRR